MKKRAIFSKILENLNNDKIVILNGARQVGKTTLLNILQEKLIKDDRVPPNRILRFDLEKVEDEAIWSDQITALHRLPLQNPGKHYIFIDEFQKCKKIGSIVKVLHDHHPQFKIILTGSATWYLDIDESLAGRKIVLPIWPLSFEEFLEWRGEFEKIALFRQIKKEPATPITPPLIQQYNQLFLEFVTFGGYPDVVKATTKEEKTALLSDLLDSYLLKDIKLWNHQANSVQVKKILTLLSSQASSLLHVPSLSMNADVTRTILDNRLELLERTFILHLSRPYFSNKSKELIKNPKLYLVDSGLRNMLLQNFQILPQTNEFGAVVENTVATNILKHLTEIDQMLYWRTKSGQEVDIVLKKENQLVPIEVKSGNEEHIPEGLKSFIRIYKPKVAFVLNWSITKNIGYSSHPKELQKTKILFRPLWWPLT